MPAAAIAASAGASRLGGRGTRAACGAILIAGGLAALGVLPGSAWWWTIAPQVLVGVGLGLALSALTERALHGRSPQAVHGGWTIAARHAGVVVGLLLLTPIFTTALDRNEDRALRAGAAAVLDSSIPPLDKLGRRTGRPGDRAIGRSRGAGRAACVRRSPRRRGVRDARGAARRRSSTGRSRPRSRGRSCSRRCSRSPPSCRSPPRGESRAYEGRSAPSSAARAPPPRSSARTSRSEGRRTSRPPVADPCAPRPARETSGTGERVELVLLAAADETACALGVSREELVLALRSVDELERSRGRRAAHGTSSRTRCATGSSAPSTRRRSEDLIGDTTASALSFAAERLPLGLLLSVLRGASSFLD